MVSPTSAHHIHVVTILHSVPQYIHAKSRAIVPRVISGVMQLGLRRVHQSYTCRHRARASPIAFVPGSSSLCVSFA